MIAILLMLIHPEEELTEYKFNCVTKYSTMKKEAYLTATYHANCLINYKKIIKTITLYNNKSQNNNNNGSVVA